MIFNAMCPFTIDDSIVTKQISARMGSPHLVWLKSYLISWSFLYITKKSHFTISAQSWYHSDGRTLGILKIFKCNIIFDNNAIKKKTVDALYLHGFQKLWLFIKI